MHIHTHTQKYPLNSIGTHAVFWLKKPTVDATNPTHTNTDTYLSHPRGSPASPSPVHLQPLHTQRITITLSSHSPIYFTFLHFLHLFNYSSPQSLTHSLTLSSTHPLICPLFCIELPVNKPSTLDGCKVGLWWSHCKKKNQWLPGFRLLDVDFTV